MKQTETAAATSLARISNKYEAISLRNRTETLSLGHEEVLQVFNHVELLLFDTAGHEEVLTRSPCAQEEEPHAGRLSDTRG